MYANDTKIFKAITGSNDCKNIQEDLNEIKNWTEE